MNSLSLLTHRHDIPVSNVIFWSVILLGPIISTPQSTKEIKQCKIQLTLIRFTFLLKQNWAVQKNMFCSFNESDFKCIQIYGHDISSRVTWKPLRFYNISYCHVAEVYLHGFVFVSTCLKSPKYYLFSITFSSVVLVLIPLDYWSLVHFMMWVYMCFVGICVWTYIYIYGQKVCIVS